ncbi:MAG: hypothetical protein AB8E82_16875, partial [Aureispira sp.]
MKKILLYSSLLILLSACSTDKHNDTSNDKTQVAAKSQTKNSSPETVAAAPTANNNCTPSTLDVYLNDPDDSGTNIRNSPGGKVVLQLVREDADAEFFLTLSQAQNGWFKIKNPIGSMEEDVEIPNGEGWIHGSVIAVDTRNYGAQTLELLDKPINGNVVEVIKEQAYGLKLKDICGRWVQVEYKGTVGWIDSNWLCGNP